MSGDGVVPAALAIVAACDADGGDAPCWADQVCDACGGLVGAGEHVHRPRDDATSASRSTRREGAAPIRSASVLADVPFQGFIPVTDAAIARDFYVGTLGLELVDDSPFAVVVKAGSTYVRITPVESLTPQPFTIAGWHVDDVAASVRALNAAGVECNRYDVVEQDELGIWTAPSGDRVAWFKDPDGNTLSVSSAPA